MKLEKYLSEKKNPYKVKDMKRVTKAIENAIEALNQVTKVAPMKQTDRERLSKEAHFLYDIRDKVDAAWREKD